MTNRARRSGMNRRDFIAAGTGVTLLRPDAIRHLETALNRLGPASPDSRRRSGRRPPRVFDRPRAQRSTTTGVFTGRYRTSQIDALTYSRPSCRCRP